MVFSFENVMNMARAKRSGKELPPPEHPGEQPPSEFDYEAAAARARKMQLEQGRDPKVSGPNAEQLH